MPLKRQNIGIFRIFRINIIVYSEIGIYFTQTVYIA